MPSGGTGPLPFRFNDFLSGSYYAIAITVILLGAVSFTFSLKWRVDDLYMREQEHPTKGELREISIKVEDRIHSLERHVEDLDVRGTRALADRTTLIEHENHAQAERIQQLIKRTDTLQESLNKFANEIPVIIDRQNNNSRHIEELRRLVLGGSPSPVGPIGPGHATPP